tara:strand:+ start:446 stop:613 length:168 start_codon:yes stop_codon:yes gene_type:complete
MNVLAAYSKVHSEVEALIAQAKADIQASTRQILRFQQMSQQALQNFKRETSVPRH